MKLLTLNHVAFNEVKQAVYNGIIYFQQRMHSQMPNIVKIKGHNFTGIYRSSVSTKLGARKYFILSYMYIELKQEVLVLVFY